MRDLDKDYRIRQFSALETWRVMGFSDEDYYKAAEVNPPTQLYKEAGNSIVVPMLEAVFRQLINGEEGENNGN